MDQRRSISAFSRCSCAGFCLGFERGHDKAILAVDAEPNLRVGRQAGIELAQRLLHRLLQVTGEACCIHGLVQRRIVVAAPDAEI